ncbi:MAG: Hsp20/alpha crystallin family protein [candidate division Zixibacteria bacterium]|nr:Hsp20/alpha crystallin family protein [candidate division Zixibacteria bacterium]
MTRCNPNRMVSRDNQEFEKFFNSFFGNQFHQPKKDQFIPRMEVTEGKENLKLQAELPGFEKDAIKIVVEDGILTISGEKKSQKKEGDPDFVWSEISKGSFSRSFTLPEYLETEKTQADYKNGVLVLTFPKTEKAIPKEIEVKIN